MNKKHPAPSQIKSLTSLRGIAAIGVVCHNYEAVFGFLSFSTTRGLFSKGYLWVDFFFLLSGFILTHNYLFDFAKNRNASNVRSFILKRFARVYPLHIFCLFCLILLQIPLKLLTNQTALSGLFAPFEGMFAPEALISNLLLVQSFGIHDTFTWNVPSWSVSAEWYSYLLFPILITFIYKKESLLKDIFLLLACLSGLFLLIDQSSFGSLDITYDFGFFRCLCSFIIGMISYKIYVLKFVESIFKSDLTFLVSILWVFGYFNFGEYDLLIVPGFVLLILCAASNKSRIGKVLKLDFLTFLGRISYSIYLLQGVLLCIAILIILIAYGEWSEIDLSVGQRLIGLFIFIFVDVVVSIIVYDKFEKPLREYLTASLKNKKSL